MNSIFVFGGKVLAPRDLKLFLHLIANFFSEFFYDHRVISLDETLMNGQMSSAPWLYYLAILLVEKIPARD